MNRAHGSSGNADIDLLARYNSFLYIRIVTTSSHAQVTAVQPIATPTKKKVLWDWTFLD